MSLFTTPTSTPDELATSLDDHIRAADTCLRTGNERQRRVHINEAARIANVLTAIAMTPHADEEDPVLVVAPLPSTFDGMRGKAAMQVNGMNR